VIRPALAARAVDDDKIRISKSEIRNKSEKPIPNPAKGPISSFFRISDFALRISLSLLLVLPFSKALEHRKPSLLGVRDGQRLEFYRGIETGDYLPHRLLARRTIRQRRGRKRPPQGEFPAAHLAIAFTEFVFVNRHSQNLASNRLMENIVLPRRPAID